MKKITLAEFLKLNPSTLSGLLIAFSTDTIFGVGTMVDEKVMEGIAKIYQMKKREPNKPIALLIDNLAQVQNDILIEDYHQPLIAKWPGALTLIFKKTSDRFPFTDQSIGIRIPNSKIARAILKTFGPMATTSVNISGTKALNSPQEIEEHFADKIDYLITDDEIHSSVASTVVDLTDGLKILRQGDIKI